MQAGESLGEVESTKSVSEIYAPISRHGGGPQRGARPTTPELINADPYGEGWLVEIEPADPAAVDGAAGRRGVPGADRELNRRRAQHGAESAARPVDPAISALTRLASQASSVDATSCVRYGRWPAARTSRRCADRLIREVVR